MTESDFFSFRRSLLPPVPEIAQAAAFLSEGAREHRSGNRNAAALAIKRADLDAIRKWTETIWGKHQQSILRWRIDPCAPSNVPRAERAFPRNPTAAMKRFLLARDGHYCRFCGIPLIRQEVRKAFQAAYPDVLSWGRRNNEQHAAFQCMWLQYDHLVPHKRGGATSPDNLVVTCAPCNFGRMNNTLEEVGLIDPRTMATLRGPWDGLESAFAIPQEH